MVPLIQLELLHPILPRVQSFGIARGALEGLSMRSIMSAAIGVGALLVNLSLGGCSSTGDKVLGSNDEPPLSIQCQISDEKYGAAAVSHDEGKSLMALGKFEDAVVKFRLGILLLKGLCVPHNVLDHSSDIQVAAEVEEWRKNYAESAVLYEGVLRRRLSIARPKKRADEESSSWAPS